MSQKESPAPVACPACERPLVNRLIDYCQYCEKALPEALRLSPDEKRAIIDSDRAWREKLREERQNRKTIKTPLYPDGSCGGSCGGDL